MINKFLLKTKKLDRMIKGRFMTLLKAEAAIGGVLWKTVFLKISQNSQENTCAIAPGFRPFLTKLQAWNFIRKETLAQVFPFEFCAIFKNIFFTEHIWTTASVKGNFPDGLNTEIDC